MIFNNGLCLSQRYVPSSYHVKRRDKRQNAERPGCGGILYCKPACQTTAVRQNDLVLGACSWVGSIGDLVVEVQLSPLLFTRRFEYVGKDQEIRAHGEMQGRDLLWCSQRLYAREGSM